MKRLEQADIKARIRMRAALGIEDDDEPARAEALLEEQTLAFAGTDLPGHAVLAMIRSGAESQEVDDNERAIGLALWSFWFGYELGRSHDEP